MWPEDGFGVLTVFVLKEAAETMQAACKQYELTRPVFYDDSDPDISDRNFKNWNRRMDKWRKKHPGGPDASSWIEFTIHEVPRI